MASHRSGHREGVDWVVRMRIGPAVEKRVEDGLVGGGLCGGGAG